MLNAPLCLAPDKYSRSPNALHWCTEKADFDFPHIVNEVEGQNVE